MCLQSPPFSHPIDLDNEFLKAFFSHPLHMGVQEQYIPAGFGMIAFLVIGQNDRRFTTGIKPVTTIAIGVFLTIF